MANDFPGRYIYAFLASNIYDATSSDPTGVTPTSYGWMHAGLLMQASRSHHLRCWILCCWLSAVFRSTLFLYCAGAGTFATKLRFATEQVNRTIGTSWCRSATHPWHIIILPHSTIYCRETGPGRVVRPRQITLAPIEHQHIFSRGRPSSLAPHSTNAHGIAH